MSRNDERQKLQSALQLHQQGNLEKAAGLYRQVIRRDPDNSDALHYLGIIEAAAGRFDKARSLMARSLARRPADIPFLENYASILFRAGDYGAALKASRRGLELDRANAAFLYVSAIALCKLKQLEESVAAFDRLLSLQPDNVVAINERGSVLAELKKHDAALASFDKALALQPHYAEAHFNKGNLFTELKRRDEALAAYDAALARKPQLADAWVGRGEILRTMQRPDEALASCEKALALNADLADAWLGRGNVLSDLRRYDEALTAYDRARQLKPELAGAWLGRGNVLHALKRQDEALAAFDKCLTLAPDCVDAWVGRVNVFTALKRYEDVVAACDGTLALAPDFVEVEAARLFAKMHVCDWENFEAERAHLLASMRAAKSATSPFLLVAVSSSADDLLHCARQYSRERFPASARPVSQGERFHHPRIRIGYFSADFHAHATSYLIAEMLERHDRSKFEIVAFSYGPQTNDDMQQRLRAAVDRFIDVRRLADRQVALLAREAEIDIAVDLKGYTQDARTGIFAERAAPIQASYLGYPGTTGAPYIDYLIADLTVIPASQQAFYSEKIVYLPDSYQVNDNARPLAERTLTRAEAGLPREGFVFCSFNNNYKTTPDVFDCWMRILARVGGSVLWFLQHTAKTAANLRKEAAARGIDPGRLVFAERTAMPDHLARQRLADLFLDTAPCNAHTTASDALWVGLPVLTRIGETFAGRVAASLLKAIGLPELVTTTPQDYEALAVDLATAPEKLQKIKRSLAAHRSTAPLFDAQRFTRHMEAAYAAMVARHEAGAAPDRIDIAQ